MESYKARVRKDVLETQCKDCDARQYLKSSKVVTDAFESFVPLSDFIFPGMEGTLRVIAFGEGVRAETLCNHICHVLKTVKDGMSTNYMINSLVNSAIENAWGNDLDETLQDSSEDILNLSLEYTNFMHKVSADRPLIFTNLLNRVSSEQALASWLMLRKYAQANTERFRVNVAKSWVSARRGYRGSSGLVSNPELDFPTILAAIVISRITSWQSREEAWNAFLKLEECSEDNIDLSVLFAQEAKNGSTLEETLEVVGIIRALNRSF